MKFIKTPLRYPGGKSRAIDTILPLVPNNFKEYREPFIGGGSVYFAVRQKYPDREYWINDLNSELYNFWKNSQKDVEDMINQILQWRKKFDNGKELFRYLKMNMNIFNEIEQAGAYFILNHLAFSGCTLVGGYSEHSYQTGFTESNIMQLKEVGGILSGTRITNLDYQKVVEAGSKYKDEDVFVMCCLPGTKVRMSDERLLNIENVKIGDSTFLGGDVLNNISRDYVGNIYEFETMGIYDNLCITEEHPLAVLRQEKAYEIRYKKKDDSLVSKFKHQDILNMLNFQFLKAKDIKVGDFLLVPCYPENISDIRTIKIGDVEVICDEDFGWVCGFWLAEGVIDHYYGKEFHDRVKLNDIKIGKQRTLSDIFGINEEFDIDKLIKKNESESSYVIILTCGDLDFKYGFIDRFNKFTGHYFDKTGRIYERRIEHSYQINFYIPEFSKYLFDNFGELAENKKICHDILNYPVDFQRGLIRGWLDGDGGIWNDKHNRGKICGTSISRQLIDDMYIISLRLGLRPATKKRMESGNRKIKIRGHGHISECFATWDMYFSSAEDIMYLYPHIREQIDFKERTKRKIINKGEKKFILVPITNILKKYYKGKVYNLTTDNHVYIANYILSHNCDPPYYSATDSGLYGKGGKSLFGISMRNLHKQFDHLRFADVMKRCKYNWLITYDDSEYIRKLFNWATIIPWNLTYGMRKVQDNVGKELFISNYLEKMLDSKQIDIESAWG